MQLILDFAIASSRKVHDIENGATDYIAYKKMIYVCNPQG